jgi:nucleoside-diphosphate-sugar epimerase
MATKTILITGAAGFIGQILAKELLSSSTNKVILTDIVEPPVPSGAKHPQNATCIKADLNDATSLNQVVRKDLSAVYIFHGIMSSGSEANFDLGMSVNIDSSRKLLEALRHVCPGVRAVYASSEAIYGRPFPASGVITDSTIPTPESSYGAAKLVIEILINDYTRRGWIDGLSLRFPTVSVRKGKPTAAASSFLSGMIREPLQGKECVLPITDRTMEFWLCSPRTLVRNLIHALDMSTSPLPSHRRSVNLPGICVSVQEMRDVLAKVGGEAKLKLLKEEEDPAQKPILESWAPRFDNEQAFKLGFTKDEGFEQAVMDFRKELEEEGGLVA